MGALLEHKTTLAPNLSLVFGGFFLHDAIDINKAERASGYYELAYRDKAQELFWRGREYNTSYLAKPGSNAAVGSVFDVDQSFSYLRSEQSVGLLLWKDQTLAPYVEAGYANLDYYKQTNPANPDRNADEFWGIGGVRVTFNKQMHVDLGVRVNERSFANPKLASSSTTGFDGKFVWTPDDNTSFEVNFDRNFEEAFVAGALVTDRQAVTMTATTKLDKNTKLTIDAGVVKYDEVGANETLLERYIEGKLSYHLDKHTELFGSALAQSIKNMETSTTTEDYRVLAGIKVSN